MLRDSARPLATLAIMALLMATACAGEEDRVHVPAPPVDSIPAQALEDSPSAISAAAPDVAPASAASVWDTSRLDELEQRLQEAGLTPGERADLLVEKAAAWLRLGHSDRALATVQEALAVQRQVWDQLTASGQVVAGMPAPESWLPGPLQLSAVAALQTALELEALAPSRLQAARYPPGPKGRHEDERRPGTAAAAAREWLRLEPGSRQAAWLLAVAEAWAGSGGEITEESRPADIPPPASWQAEALHVDLRPSGPTGDLAVADFTGDGLDDVLMASLAPGPGLRLFAGRTSGPPQEATAMAGLGDMAGGRVLHTADVNRDGAMDVLILGSDDARFARAAGVRLLIHHHGSLEDMTAATGLQDLAADSAAWLDMDGDGDLDLLLEGGDGARLLHQVAPLRFAAAPLPPQAWWNRPPGRFLLPLGKDAQGLDVVLMRHGPEAMLLRAGSPQGPVSQSLALPAMPPSGPACLLDADGDGDRDLFMAPGPPPESAAVSGTAAAGTVPLLLLQSGEAFGPAEAVSTRRPVMAGALVCADFNRDGRDDVYVASHDGGHPLFLPHRLLLSTTAGWLESTANMGGGLVLPAVASAVLIDAQGRGDIVVLSGSTDRRRPRILTRLSASR